MKLDSKNITTQKKMIWSLTLWLAVALMANAVVKSAKKTKGHYVLVSKKKLKTLKQALEQLKKK